MTTAHPHSPHAASLPVAYPPETAEGWYAFHQIFRIRPGEFSRLTWARSHVFDPPAPETAGWSIAVQLMGSVGDVMFVHFRPTLDDIGKVQRALAREQWMAALEPVYTFLSVTEAGLYRMTAEVARKTVQDGGQVGDAAYQAAVAERRERDIADPHTQKRLYPAVPDGMPYVCFYPMSKRRAVGQNWYALPLEERSRLMYEHSKTGRKYAGRIFQVIAGSIGLDAWEWGVTLFAADPLEFKKIVSEMRFDEASAQYGEFGAFYVGRMGSLQEVLG